MSAELCPYPVAIHRATKPACQACYMMMTDNRAAHSYYRWLHELIYGLHFLYHKPLGDVEEDLYESMSRFMMQLANQSIEMAR